MIRPQTNLYREAISLDGVWTCRPDPDESGAAKGWACGFADGLPIAIPGSWNEQLAECGLMNYVGVMWLQREVIAPARAADLAAAVYFGSADYRAEVYLDGVLLGQSEAMHLPFQVDAGAFLRPGAKQTLVVKIDNRLPEGAPMQRVTRADYVNERRPKDEYFPAVRFDFFPFGGLNRSVYLILAPKAQICARRIEAGRQAGQATLRVATMATHPHADVQILLDGVEIGRGPAEGNWIAIAAARLAHAQAWSPAAPRLYALTLRLLDGAGQTIDEIEDKIGFRDIRVDGQRLLLNGDPLVLRGFGKHEDSPLHGRGVNLPLLVKDFNLLRWIGANSVRTSHYPYDESFLDMADAAGVLVISECFSVNLDFRKIGPDDLPHHCRAMDQLLARDHVHPCVIAWSLSNEPGYLGEPDYPARALPYWRQLFAHVRHVDPTRPLTVANVQYAGEDDPAFAESDFLSVNRYYGWYTEPGQLDRAQQRLQDLLDRLSETHGKPIFVSEFGADAIAGLHATTDQLWTEDYQADFLAAYWAVIARHPAAIGGHVWNFADFRTAQHGRRVVFNHKGVFTRTRDPKRAAFTLRALWSQTPANNDIKASETPQGGDNGLEHQPGDPLS